MTDWREKMEFRARRVAFARGSSRWDTAKIARIEPGLVRVSCDDGYSITAQVSDGISEMEAFNFALIVMESNCFREGRDCRACAA